MDISKARRLVELEKDGVKMLVTLWDKDNISCCTTAAEQKQTCESCQGDAELCNDYVEHLKSKGFSATEIEIGGDLEESLPRFFAEREGTIRVTPGRVTVAAEPEGEQDAQQHSAEDNSDGGGKEE